jgi:cardiolipin synthase
MKTDFKNILLLILIIINSVSMPNFYHPLKISQKKNAYLRQQFSLFVILFLCFILLFTGCGIHPVRNVKHLKNTKLRMAQPVAAYSRADDICLRFHFRGKDVYMFAKFDSISHRDDYYLHQAVNLSPYTGTGSALKRWLKQAHEITILQKEQWQQLESTFLQSLQPEKVFEGILFSIQTQKMVLYKDDGNQLKVVKFENKPEKVRIVEAFNDETFTHQGASFLENNLLSINDKNKRFLYIVGEQAGDTTPFIYIDLSNHLSAFLNYPSGSDYRSEGNPLGFTINTIDAFLIRSHLITIIKNPFTSIYRLASLAKYTGVCFVNSGISSAGTTISPAVKTKGMDLDAWEKKLDMIAPNSRYRGEMNFLIGGKNFFTSLFQSIEEAKNSIKIRVYVFDNDDYAVKVADLLKARSENIKVKVLMDELGSLFAGKNKPESQLPHDFTIPKSIKSYLKQNSRLKVRKTSNPWLTADHTKTIIIDNKKAYIGGMNIGREYRYDWHDFMTEVEGPVVGRLNKDFHKAWAHAGPTGDFGFAWVSAFKKAKVKYDEDRDDYIDIRLLYTKTGKPEIYTAQIAAIREAQSYIYIQNAYFADNAILDELIKARARGVDVRVILPSRNDVGIMNISNQITANTMIKNNIRVYIYPGMSHVKAAIYDGWACMGSANFDKFSLMINQETNIATSHRETVNRLKHELFEVDFARSKECTEKIEVGWSAYLVEFLANQL